MITAFVIVVTLALLPQILFSFLYWRWVPAWRKNPYGRLAQLDAWCRIIFYAPVLYFTIFGRGSLSREDVLLILTSCLVPVIFLGALQLYLLRKAVDEAKTGKDEGEFNGHAS